MKVEINNHQRCVDIKFETDFESQAVWDILCREEKPNAAELEVTIVSNVLSVRRKDWTKNYVWCECGDALTPTPIMRKTKEYGKIFSHNEYYCLGCNKTYVLKEKVKK